MLGEVKTRLARDIGDAAALDVYRRLLASSVVAVAPFPGRELWTAGEQSAFASLAELDGWPRHEQTGIGLGARMSNAFADGVDVLIGADIPSLDKAYLDTAAAALRASDVVLGPTDDGGYCLIALRVHDAHVFSDIEWSTPRVLEQTLARCRDHDLEVTLLDTLWDVDTVADYERAKANRLI